VLNTTMFLVISMWGSGCFVFAYIFMWRGASNFQYIFSTDSFVLNFLFGGSCF
jgi:hypothetical protein